MKKYINVLLTVVVLGFVAVSTANAQSSRDFRPDFDYYDDEFDWRWDVRVRISDGISNGLLTRSEANRLYRRLERIEEKEYAYAADGFYDTWEQDDVWRDVQLLHRRVGLELSDYDRLYYGFNPVGIAFTGYPRWWYNGGYNFYRFDRRGWGSIRVGYTPRYFVPVWVPNRTIYINNYHSYGHRYYRTDNRNRVVYYDRNTNVRDVTRSPRTSGRNEAVYNRNNDNRRAVGVTSNSGSRSSSVERSRSAAPNQNTTRTRTYTRSSESLNRSNGVDTRSREVNRPTTRTNGGEYSRPVAPSSSRVETPSRSSTNRSESFNRSSSSSSSRSATPSRNYERSSSNSRSSGSVNRSSSSSRTKVPEASRSSSSSRSSRSSSSATTSPRRNN